MKWKDKMNISPAIIAAVMLAFFGFVASVSGVILHLRVQNVFSRVNAEITKIDTRIEQVRYESSTSHGEVKLSLEQLKTRLAETNAESYKQIMTETRRIYVERELADAKHLQNVQRMDALSDGLRSFKGDLKEHRESMERRLTAIEERLPV